MRTLLIFRLLPGRVYVDRVSMVPFIREIFFSSTETFHILRLALQNVIKKVGLPIFKYNI